jgi:hypothetical protein
VTGRSGAGRGLVALIVAGTLAAALGGCSDGDEDAAVETTTTFVVETDEGTQAFASDDDEGSFSFESDDGRGTLTFDLDGDGVTAEGEGGSFELSPGTPADWPGEFPVPDGAEVVGGNVVEASPLRQLTTVYRLTTPAADVVAFYEEALADDLPLVDIRDERPETYQGSVSFEGEHVGFLTVTAVLGGTELAVQLVVEDS